MGQKRSVRAAFGQTVTKTELSAAPDGYEFKFTVSLFGEKKKKHADFEKIYLFKV